MAARTATEITRTGCSTIKTFSDRSIDQFLRPTCMPWIIFGLWHFLCIRNTWRRGNKITVTLCLWKVYPLYRISFEPCSVMAVYVILFLVLSHHHKIQFNKKCKHSLRPASKSLIISLLALKYIQMFCLLLVSLQSLSRCVPGIGMYFCTLHGLTQSFGR